jgi:hypothetical protein
MNSATINMGVQMSLWHTDFISIRYMPRSSAGSLSYFKREMKCTDEVWERARAHDMDTEDDGDSGKEAEVQTYLIYLSNWYPLLWNYAKVTYLKIRISIWVEVFRFYRVKWNGNLETLPSGGPHTASKWEVIAYSHMAGHLQELNLHCVKANWIYSMHTNK